MHFIVKTHKKDRFPAEQIQKLIAYFLEKSYKFNIDEPIVVLFDMTDAGYSNTVSYLVCFNEINEINLFFDEFIQNITVFCPLFPRYHALGVTVRRGCRYLNVIHRL